VAQARHRSRLSLETVAEREIHGHVR
jgi:hypothetical protein